jgi:hypothetical protein
VVAGKDVTMMCKTDTLCGGLQGGIDGEIHAAQAMWDSHHMEENWGFLLIDVRNVFNEQDRMVMLWKVQHRLPSGARFMFNSYKYWSTLVIRNNNGSDEFLLSQKRGHSRRSAIDDRVRAGYAAAHPSTQG